VSKADLRTALAASGATDQSIPSPGVDVPVSFTLTVGSHTYSLTENFNYKSQAGKTGRGKFNFKSNVGSINQGFFVITRGSAQERDNGESHFLEFDGLLALPMGKLLQAPSTGTFQFTFSGSTPTTLLFDRISQKGSKVTYEQTDRALSIIKKLTIDTKSRTFSVSTWDVPRNEVQGGTGIPVHDAPVLNFFFELRFDFDQPDGTTFRGVAATLLSRASAAEVSWKSGPKK
jgi:hypothetical protein